MIEESKLLDTTAQTTLNMQTQRSPTDQAARAAQGSIRRAVTRSPRSRYLGMPTSNTKFEKFLDALFTSQMSRDEIREEIGKYYNAIDSNYQDRVLEM